jgi:hypothetical protein
VFSYKIKNTCQCTAHQITLCKCTAELIATRFSTATRISSLRLRACSSKFPVIMAASLAASSSLASVGGLCTTPKRFDPPLQAARSAFFALCAFKS